MLYALNGSAINHWATLYAGGAAALELVGAGTGTDAHVLGTGLAELDLSAEGLMVLAKPLGAGAGAMELNAHHGMPNPMPIPDAFMGAHHRAVMLVPPQARAMRVPAETIARVRAPQRPARVPRERKL